MRRTGREKFTPKIFLFSENFISKLEEPNMPRCCNSDTCRREHLIMHRKIEEMVW